MEKQDIPETLRPVAEAAVLWFNLEQGHSFELTGLVDYESALTADPTEAYELGLILCDGEICARQQVGVQPGETGPKFSFIAAQAAEIPPLLDPPVGVRANWLDTVLAKHEFVLLLFYRGLW